MSKERPDVPGHINNSTRRILNVYRNAFHSVGAGLFFYLLHKVSVTAHTKYHNVYTQKSYCKHVTLEFVEDSIFPSKCTVHVPCSQDHEQARSQSAACMI